MKKILFIINNMNIGGIQKALLELLKELTQRQNLSVRLFCCNQHGELLGKVPEAVQILPDSTWAQISELSVAKSKGLGKKYTIFRCAASTWSKLLHKALPAKVLCSLIGNLGTYDVAISFSQPIHDKAFCNLTNEIALNCCKAKRKVVFVHCDFQEYGGNTRRNRNLLGKFDAVAAVSNSVGDRIKKCVPAIADKVYTVYNCCDKSDVLRFADTDPVKYRQKAIVTVARLSEEKGLLRCIPIIAELSKQFAFEWHIVGGGPMQHRLQATIAECGMEKTIVLEGEQTNPYRFMKYADYLLLPSFHEAAPMVFDEAAILGVPILTTDTLSAKELVSDRSAGMVCDNTSEGLYHMLYAALQSPKKKTNPSMPDQEFRMKQFDAVCGIKEL